MSNNDSRWVVWYLHWRFHSSSVETNDWYRTKDEAFYGAWHLENEADDCVNDVIGIEDPGGNFIDMREYRDARESIGTRHDEEEKRSRDEDREQPKFRITITGPPRPDGIQKGTVYKKTEVWTAEYLDKYRDEAIAQYGADRVTVEPVAQDGGVIGDHQPDD
jgi:hypothetical protein